MSEENMISKFERKAQTQIGSQLCMPFFVGRALSEDSPDWEGWTLPLASFTLKKYQTTSSHSWTSMCYFYVFIWLVQFLATMVLFYVPRGVPLHVQRGILDFIHQARSSEQHHILVNCVQGISRSAAVVSQWQTSNKNKQFVIRVSRLEAWPIQKFGISKLKQQKTCPENQINLEVSNHFAGSQWTSPWEFHQLVVSQGPGLFDEVCTWACKNTWHQMPVDGNFWNQKRNTKAIRSHHKLFFSVSKV